MGYVRRGAAGLGWHATVAGGLLAIHMAPDEWGHNAREHSSTCIAIELAQSTAAKPISDEAVESAAWYIRDRVLARWPDLPLNLVSHASLPAGRRDGKTDPFPVDDPRWDDLRARVRAWLG